MANYGKKVLIIDSDLRNGKQAKIFRIPNDLGFSNLLSGLDDDGKEIEDNISLFIKDTEINNLSVITSGTVPPNPTELISLPKMSKIFKQLSKIFDIIIIDGTSTLISDEALLLARIVSSTILVLDYNSTNKNEFIQAKEDIENVGGNIIGVVINKSISAEKINVIKKIANSFKSALNRVIIKIKSFSASRKTKLLEEGRFDKDYNKIDVVFERKDKIDNNYINKDDDFAKKDLELKENNIEDTSINLKNDLNDNKKIDNSIILNNSKDESDTNINNKSVKDSNLADNNKIDEIIVKDIENKNKIQTPIEENENSMKLNDSDISNNIGIDEKNTNEDNDDRIIIKPAIVLKAIKNRISGNEEKNEKKVSNIYKKKEDIKNENNEKIVNIEFQNRDEELHIEQPIDADEIIVVIVDGERGACMAFNKKCYTEKLVRGFDKADGFYKEYYSLNEKNRRIKGLMNIYNITKKQAKRVDPLVYETLLDLDEKIWIEEKKENNIADTYVRCISAKYEKIQGESKRKFEERCRNLRYNSLKLMGIEIEYKLDTFFNSNNMSFTDKIEMSNYSKVLKIETNHKNMNKNNVDKINTNIDSLSNSESNNKQDNNDNSAYERIIEKEKQKKIKVEKRKEAEVLRKVERERSVAKRKKIKHEKEKKNEERKKLREENRKIREIERIKQREEARIEEELLEDNLYPKTKNNKNLF